MDSKYNEFIWLTVKEYCSSCVFGSLLLAVIAFVAMLKNIVFVGPVMLCVLFAMVFTLGNRCANYIVTMIQLEREENA